MADSDDEYDRKRRDKFRGERSAGENYRGSDRRDDRARGGREDWQDRARPRTDYRDYRQPRDRGYSPGREGPPMKRVRGDWGDEGRHRFGGHEAGYGMYGYGHDHYGLHPGPGYGHPPPNTHPREQQASTDLVTQPCMMTLKQFLATQDDSISDLDAIQKYNDYKLEFKRQQLNDFFVVHKDEEWFKIKYHPEESCKRREEQLRFLKKRCEVFINLLDSNDITKVTVDTSNSDTLLRLLDTVVIKLEGGTDEDLKILDEKPVDLLKLIEKAKTEIKKEQIDDDKKKDTVVEPAEIKEKEKDKEEGTEKAEEEKIDNDDDQKDIQEPTEGSEEPPVVEEESKKKDRKKRSRSDSASSSSSSSSSSSDSDNDENDEKKDEEKAATHEAAEVSPKSPMDEEMKNDDPAKSEDEEVDDAMKVDEKNEVEKEDDEKKEDEKEKEDEEEKEDQEDEEIKEASVEKEDAENTEKDEQMETEDDPEKKQAETAAEAPEKQKETPTEDIEEGEEGEEDGEPKKEEKEKPAETIDLAKECVPEEETPRALHKTSSIFLRNLAPSITKDEVEATCKRFNGFLRVAIADPLLERRWFRRGWVTFKREVNIKEICWNLNNIRLRECELGAIVNRDLSRRVRPVNGITSHKTIVRSDIKLVAKIAHNLDDKSGLWREENKANEEKNGISFGLNSRNPVLQNITDYLIEEASAEEEELLGLTSEVKDTTDGEMIERDPQLITVLDKLILYLRIVHSVDFYNHCEYPYEDEMPNRCGIIHARGPPPQNKIINNEIQEYIRTFEGKMASFLTKNAEIENEELKKLGAKDTDAEVEKFIAANTQELAKDKWLCPLSGKKFKGPDFIRKHIFNKHGEKVDEVRKEVEYFNNYLKDTKRPQLPEHPGNTKKLPVEHQQQSVGFRPSYGVPGGYAPYANGYVPPMIAPAPRARLGGYGRGRVPAPDYRPVIHYRDLDAPREPDDFL